MHASINEEESGCRGSRGWVVQNSTIVIWCCNALMGCKQKRRETYPWELLWVTHVEGQNWKRAHIDALLQDFLPFKLWNKRQTTLKKNLCVEEHLSANLFIKGNMHFNLEKNRSRLSQLFGKHCFKQILNWAIGFLKSYCIGEKPKVLTGLWDTLIPSIHIQDSRPI